MSEDELCKIIGNYDAWIIGDDPCTEKVIETGIKGKLKALVKWGVGVDNVDFEACKKHTIPVTNTHGMFGEEKQLRQNSKLLNYEQNIYGSHNGSNTVDVVLKTSRIALENLDINIETWGEIQQSVHFCEKCKNDLYF